MVFIDVCENGDAGGWDEVCGVVFSSAADFEYDPVCAGIVEGCDSEGGGELEK